MPKDEHDWFLSIEEMDEAEVSSWEAAEQLLEAHIELFIEQEMASYEQEKLLD